MNRITALLNLDSYQRLGKTHPIILIITLTLLHQANIFCQCPPLSNGNYHFETQEQIDKFLENYPDCELLSAKQIHIILDNDENGTPIHDLTPLSQIREVAGCILITGESSRTPQTLTSLHGLHNLRKLKGLSLTYVRVQDLSELCLLDSIENLTLSVCENLTNIGCNNLKVTDWLSLIRLGILESLEGIRVSDEVRYIGIQNCENLRNVSTLNNLKKVQSLWLNHFDISFVRNIEKINTLYINGNGPIQDLRDFENLNEILAFTLIDLKELEDLSFLKNVQNKSTFTTIALINNSELSDISILTEVGEVTELHRLELTDCDKIIEFSVFDELRIVSFLKIQDMDGITDLSNFNNLENAKIRVFIANNSNLVSFDGLNNLDSIGYDLLISENERLLNIDALYNLSFLGFGPPNTGFDNGSRITIEKNNSLNSIIGLNNAFANIKSLRIKNNPNLELCHLNLVCQSILEGNPTLIDNNGPRCNNIKEVENQCNYPVFQKIFLDQNENGELDNEPQMTLGHTIYNDIYRLFPNNNGVINLSPFDGQIDLEYIPDSNWRTTTEDTYSFPNSDNVDPMFIGISPVVDIDDVSIHLSFDQLVCSQDYYISLTVSNKGTSILDTEITLDGIGLYVSSSVDPITSDTSTVVFEILDLLPGQTKEISLLYFAPNITDVPLGTVLSHNLTYDIFNQSNELVADGEKIYGQELLCAYDPNDKQVFPSGLGDNNKTLKTEELQYLIRFQNTGNYYAEDIVIRDTLNENLDLKTFNFISASHPISEIRMERNALAFVFENIFLPDSIRNEPESHGFLSYSIKANSDIEEGVVIDNTAHIYFDSNPAIVTNTVKNEMVTRLQVFENIEIEICQGESFEGYMDTGIYQDTFLTTEGCDSIRTLDLTVLDAIGSIIEVEICEGQSHEGYDMEGTYEDNFTSLNGCDSIRILELSIRSSISEEVTMEICEGTEHEGYDMSGTYHDDFVTESGCDSTRILMLTVIPKITEVLNIEICSGESYEGYETAGTYEDDFQTTTGCDSTRTLHLSVYTEPQESISIEICKGASFEGYEESGIYEDKFVGTNGCDSIRLLDLTVIQQIETTQEVLLCIGEEYKGIREPGLHSSMTTNKNGCDSISHINIVHLDRDDPICSFRYDTDPHNFEDTEFLQVYPNPGHDLVTLIVDKPERIPSQLEILSAKKEHIMTIDILQEETQIDISEFPKGLYIFILRDELNLFVHKVFKF